MEERPSVISLNLFFFQVGKEASNKKHLSVILDDTIKIQYDSTQMHAVCYECMLVPVCVVSIIQGN